MNTINECSFSDDLFLKSYTASPHLTQLTFIVTQCKTDQIHEITLYYYMFIDMELSLESNGGILIDG